MVERLELSWVEVCSEMHRVDVWSLRYDREVVRRILDRLSGDRLI